MMQFTVEEDVPLTEKVNLVTAKDVLLAVKVVSVAVKVKMVGNEIELYIYLTFHRP